MARKPKRRPDRGRFLFGVLLTIGYIFLTVSLVSYSPVDSPLNVVQPSGVGKPFNLCGSTGAALADWLIQSLGVGAWFLLIPLCLRLVSYWTRRELTFSVLKTIGVLLILIALSGLVNLFFPNLSIGSLTGPGGRLGAVVLFFLEPRFATLGLKIFFFFLLAGGMILACNTSLLRFLLLVTGIQPLAELLTEIFLGPKIYRKLFPRGTRPTSATEIPSESPSPFHLTESPDISSDSMENDSTDSPIGFSTDEEISSPQVSTKKPVPPASKEREPDSSTSTPHRPKPSESRSRSERPYEIPSISILERNPQSELERSEEAIRQQIVQLQQAFANFNCDVRVTEYQSGPVVTLFELELAKGIRLNQIQGLTDDLAIAMRLPSVRIVAPIPGKNSVGIEVPNPDRQLVRLRDVMEEGAEIAKKMEIPLFIGKDASGFPLVADLCKLPHLLIAGRTGTGKSVCLNSLILSILMTRTPDEVRLLLFDPKMVELSPYKTVPHLLHPVVTDMKKASAIFGWVVEKMEERYALLARAGVRQLKEYNRLGPERLRQRTQPESEEEWNKIPKRLSSLVIIADEVADMMAVAGKEISEHIARLAQKSRAVGVYLILATQKPTVDVITGLIKSNLPARIAFGVATQSDSRVILDANGAEQLLGNGDLLFLNSVTNQIIRGQGTFVSGDEIDSVIYEISVEKPDFVDIDIQQEFEEVKFGDLPRDRDPRYNEAVEFVLNERRGSTSLLQRRFSIGYGRAARIIDMMEAEGILGPKSDNDSKPREVLMTFEEWKASVEKEEAKEAPSGFTPNLPESRRLPSDEERRKSRERHLSDNGTGSRNAPWEEIESSEPSESSFEEEIEDEDFEEEDFTDEEAEEEPDEMEEEPDDFDEEEDDWDEDEGTDSEEVDEESSEDVTRTSGTRGEESSDSDFSSHGTERNDEGDELIPITRPHPNLREMANNRRRKNKNKNKKKNKRKRRR